MAKLSWNKWQKYKVLKRSAALRSHLPETHWMNRQALLAMLRKYNKIILKPTNSSGGFGVLQVSSISGRRFEVHAGKSKHIVRGTPSLATYVQRKTTRSYLIQRKIKLATVQKRPFDLRVMVQRSRNRGWAVTGKLVKLAGKGYIVTNVARSGGKVLTVSQALHRSNISGYPRQRLLKSINRVSLHSAVQLQKSYQGIRTIGLDIGVDHRGQVWIIEANFTPMKALFRKLKDKSMYRRIISYR